MWCNSVIEHVTVSKEHRDQMSHEAFVSAASAHQSAFAAEISRISQRYCVQTPNLHYPLESHAVLPLVQYLEMPQRERLAELTSKFWIAAWEADYLLFDRDRFAAAFPDADEIIDEKTLGLTKSFTAIRRG